MMSRTLCLLAAASLLAGCASQQTDGAGGEGGAGVTVSVSETASSVASSVVASSVASTGTGGPCAQDCSTIEVPACFVSKCNTITHACEVAEAPEATPCEDGLFCTANDTCHDGVCEPGAAPDCGAEADPCLVQTCDEASQSCTATPAVNGSSCTAPDVCQSNAICQNGHCIGAPKDCSAEDDECHVGSCDVAQAGLCVKVPGNDGFPCSASGDPCMVDKVCSAGACIGGVPKDCSALSTGCNNGLCEAVTGNCYQEPVLPGGPCLEATNDCNQGFCDNGGNCLPTPFNDGGSCNDASSCTINDVCSAGACAGVPDPTYTTYFNEDFSDNSAGWTLGTEWQIGSATASTSIPHSGTFADPAQDHTTTSDNGIAGIVIGGVAANTPHAFAYLTSPVYDLGTIPGSVFLEYWHWLNSDYPDYMIDDVEAFDGTTWVTIWQNLDNFTITSEGAWTKQSIDVTPYKNAGFQIRFGLSVASGAYSDMSSWNIDDVSLASAPCN